MRICYRFIPVFLILIATLFLNLPLASAVQPPEKPAGVEATPAFPGDSWNITERGRWAHGPCQAVTVMSGITLASSGAYLQVIDLRNPLFPSLLGRVALPGNIEGIDWDGMYAYVANRNAGFQIVDTSTPGNPKIASGVDLSYRVYGVEYRSGYAYVAAEYGGLFIIDVSNAKAPVEVGHYDTPGRALGVTVDGDYAYVADDSEGLRIINISKPGSPTETGYYDTPGYAVDVVVSGGIAYVADYTEGMIALDVSTPASPSLYGSFPPGGYYVWDVQVSGSVAYLSTINGGLERVNVAMSGKFPLIDRYDPGGSMYDIVLEGTEIFAACDNYGVRVIDISGTPPSLVGTTGGWDFTFGVGYSNNHAFIANNGEGVVVVNVSDPDNPSQVGLYDTPDKAQDVTVVGKTAYVSDRFGGLIVLDVSTPSTPTYVGSWDTPGTAHSTYVSGNFAYVADGPQGLRIIDIGIPAAPVEAGYLDTPGEACDVVVRGEYAFVSDGNEGLRVIDITPPTSPSEVTFVKPSLGWVNTAAFYGDYLFVSKGYQGVMVLDVTDPTSPDVVTEITGGWTNAIDLEVDGDYLYVSDREFGVRVYYIINPDNPLLVGTFANGDWIEAMVVNGTRIFIAEQHTGMTILDFNPPPTPTAIQAFDARAAAGVVELSWTIASDDAISGYRVYRGSGGAAPVLANRGGLLPPEATRYTDTNVSAGMRYEYTLAVVLGDGTEITSQTVEALVPAGELVLYQNYPNPFNPATAISFVVPAPMRVNLSVYDASGALVRTLVDQNLESGLKRESWNGRDENGRPVSSGVYFCRLTAGKETLTRKMVLLK